MFHYSVGDTVTYRTTMDNTRTVRVTNKEADINGQPGFDGVMSDGTTVWGYDRQIVRVMVQPLVIFG